MQNQKKISKRKVITTSIPEELYLEIKKQNIKVGALIIRGYENLFKKEELQEEYQRMLQNIERMQERMQKITFENYELKKEIENLQKNNVGGLL
jgi:CHASE3 domain sensor protein